MNRLPIGYLYINFLRNKFDTLKLLDKNSLDIFMIFKTKLDETFPKGQFLMDRFIPPYTLGCLIQGEARLLIFRFGEASLTLPQCYAENKKC